MTEELDFKRDGAALVEAALSQADLATVESALADLPVDQPGIRLTDKTGLSDLIAVAGPVGSVATTILGPGAFPVRMILFDKGERNNWALGWHQDRTIAVRKRIEVAGFGPWTVKAGIPHVAPPMAVLDDMVTLRVHLDDVDATNAPLLIALGSHRIGLIPEAELPAAVAGSTVSACFAKRGDVWLYSTPIIHASERASNPSRRRVLQIDYAATDLPNGLEWFGV